MDNLHRVKPFEIKYYSDYAVLKSLLLVQFNFFWITKSWFYLTSKDKAQNQLSHFSL